MKSSIIATIAGAALHTVLFCAGSLAADAFHTPDSAIEKITQCLQDGLEAYMGEQGPECVVRNTGRNKTHATGMPFNIANVAATCESDAPPDQRRLSGDTVKRVLRRATELARPIAPSGIRIVGAIFCGTLDITGLDLPYSLVLDNSAFAGTVNVRNVRIRGDLSLDEGFLAGSLILARTRIEGSFYAETGVIRRIVVSDTYIQGSWHQTSSIVLSNSAFFGMTLSGDAYFSSSALSMLSLDTSVIHGALSLTDTESRCGYHVRSSEIGVVFAEKFGFGKLRAASELAPNPARDKVALYLPWWARLAPAPDDEPRSVGARLASAPVQRLIAAEIEAVRNAAAKHQEGDLSGRLPGCENLTGSPNAEFHFLNNRVRTNLCLRSFLWLERGDATKPPTTVLSLNGTSMSGSLIVDLWGREQIGTGGSAPPDTASTSVSPDRGTRKFEAMGVSMGALIFDFTDNKREYDTYIDGITFSQVQTASVNCAFQRVSEGGVAQAINTKGGVIQQPSLPAVQDVMDWLEKNGAHSSQPFSAFVAAFEHAGADTSELRVARKTLDLCERANWLRYIMTCPKGIAARVKKNAAGAEATALGGMVSSASDFVSIVFQYALFRLADHGIRPAKVVVPLVFVLVSYLVLFWFVFGIIGFEPKEKSSDGKPAGPAKPRTLGFLFLFDRLIPIYKIKEEHYFVGRYFRGATTAEIGAGSPDPVSGPFLMRRYLMNRWVTPIADGQKDCAENWLVALRVIGAVLAVFLVAAITSLTRG